jgi:hypothetical protein
MVQSQNSTVGSDEVDNVAIRTLEVEIILSKQDSYLGDLQYEKDKDEWP